MSEVLRDFPEVCRHVHYNVYPMNTLSAADISSMMYPLYNRLIESLKHLPVHSYNPLVGTPHGNTYRYS